MIGGTGAMADQPNLRSGREARLRGLSFVAAGLLIAACAFHAAIAGDYRAPAAPAPQAAQPTVGAQSLALGIGKSVVIDLPRDIKDVLVADPKIANAVVRSSQRAYIIGAAVGQTNIFFFDANGQQIAAYDIAVKRDLNGVRAALRQTLPSTDIDIEGVGDGVMLTGTATSPAESQQAYEIAGRLVGDAAKVVNSIVVRGRDQVMLKVTVAEVRRDIIKQLGVDLTGSLNFGTAVVTFSNSNPFAISGKELVESNAITNSFKSVSATIRAMERAGVMRTLAEPNLTAISGEAAAFLAGGEFPIPKGYTCDPATHICQIQVEFKKFGIT
jgi:pilus assembly protein CpaC